MMRYTVFVFHHTRLAQLVRASRLHREGQGFESLGAYYYAKAGLIRVLFLYGTCREDEKFMPRSVAKW